MSGNETSYHGNTRNNTEKKLLRLVREIVFPNLFRCPKAEHRDYKIPMQQKRERRGPFAFIFCLSFCLSVVFRAVPW